MTEQRSRQFWPRSPGKKNAAPRTDLRPCDHPGCRDYGDYRAPKSRETLNEYYWFCLDHVRAYNASWDYYAGLDPEEIETMVRSDTTWQRPTWPLGKRMSGNFRFDAAKMRDGFGVFEENFGESAKPAAPAASTAEMNALKEMNLSYPLTIDLLRARYKELCKLHHPDANGGDKQAEERFKRIGQAYKTLMESLA
jgi:hypothetical protein